MPSNSRFTYYEGKSRFSMLKEETKQNNTWAVSRHYQLLWQHSNGVGGKVPGGASHLIPLLFGIAATQGRQAGQARPRKSSVFATFKCNRINHGWR